MGRQRSIAVAALLLSASIVALADPGAAQSQMRPELEYDGAIATGLALRRLGNTARILHIGAHPDDENTALFAPLALGRGADAAYLSLTRGEGGQNSLGPELGVALGLIRTEELLAARRIDGATQFFTRAVDFGFSKNAEETFTHWPRDSVLADVVAVIRRYRPDAVVSVWSGTPRDGHGHHEASGILAREAVLAAGDPERFPEQIEAGLRPHTVERYYWSARYGADGPDVELSTGELDPLLGRSYHQIAMASRSRHRSQDMGVPQAPGPRRTQFDLVDPGAPPAVVMESGYRPPRQLEGNPGIDGSLFAGVDTLLSQRASAGGFPEVAELLRSYESEVFAARDDLDPYVPWKIVPRLVAARDRLAEARATLPESEAADLRFHVEAEAGDLEAATIAASNLQFGAVSDDELIVPGQEFELELWAWNGGGAPAAVRMKPALPDGWSARRLDDAAVADGGPNEAAATEEARGEAAATEGPRGEAAAGGSGFQALVVTVPSGSRAVSRWNVRVPHEAAPTMPYYLADESGTGPGSLYEWPDDNAVRGLPFARAPVRGRFAVAFGSRTGGAEPDGGPEHGFRVEREATWIGLDARAGEFHRPVRVVPRVSVQLTRDLVVIPLERIGSPDGRRLRIGVTVRNEAPDSVRGTLRFAVSRGWTGTPDAVDFVLAPEGGERTLQFEMTPPADLRAGEHHAGAIFSMPIPGCDTMPCAAMPRYFVSGYDVIDYPHIEPHHLYRRATSRVRALDVRVADIRVGYVAGVPDGIPEALEQLGVRWESLDDAALADGNLSRFDVIVTATRAYEVRPELVASNQRLLDWARGGGTLVVQYNKYPALEGSYAPWPVTIARPHGRITDETAPVTILEPDHPVFNTPNRLDPSDWEGWVQERGLYLWETWGGPLHPLLAMSDPGEAPLEGSLLVAPFGEGTYVYSALALFRQLPAGVPGAWRLLANLISLGDAAADGGADGAADGSGSTAP